MKKVLIPLLVTTICLTGCFSVGISKADYEALQNEKESIASEFDATKKDLNEANEKVDSLTKEVEEKDAKLSAISDELDKTKNESEALKQEYEEYKEQMKEYEGLAEAEAEARMIEAERVKQEAEEEAARKAEEERLAAEEAAREAEEKEKLGYDTGITYDQLARNPEQYEGEKVKFSGEVIQVMEDSKDNSVTLRIATRDSYDDVIIVYYNKDIVSSRVLEDDYITIYGASAGLYTYESTGAGMITIPLIYVEKIDQ